MLKQPLTKLSTTVRQRVMQVANAETKTALSSYMRDLADADVMTAEEERAAAEHIHHMRAERWKVLLSYPPIAAGMLALIGGRLADAIDPPVLGEAARAAQTLRSARRVKHERAYTKAMATLAEALAEADRDQIVADMVCADLESLEAGRFDGLNMTGAAPRRTDTFSRYVRKVRRANAGFHAARNAFVRANLRLVVSLTRRYGRGRMPTEDLVQEGNLGLMKAVDRFDPSKGFRFSTYGAWWIRHAINRAIQNKSRNVRLPVHVLDAIQKLTEARRAFEAEFGVRPDHAELSESTGLSIDKIERLERALIFDQPTPIDESDDDAFSSSRRAALIDESTPGADETLEQRLVARAIDEAIAELPEMERDILRRRFALDGDTSATLREIGEQYSLSRERIRQLQERAIGRIRSELQARDLV